MEETAEQITLNKQHPTEQSHAEVKAHEMLQDKGMHLKDDVLLRWQDFPSWLFSLSLFFQENRHEDFFPHENSLTETRKQTVSLLLVSKCFIGIKIY